MQKRVTLKNVGNGYIVSVPKDLRDYKKGYTDYVFQSIEDAYDWIKIHFNEGDPVEESGEVYSNGIETDDTA